ncbi:MAG: YesU family protein [Pyrinomonadaceae bacterium]|nr:YesU family protein [Pyrinomonadaceae bacterium]
MENGKWKICLILMILIFSFSAFAQNENIKTSPVIDAPIDVSKYKLKKVYDNDFSKSQKIAFEKNFIKQNADGSWIRTGKPDSKAEWIAEGLGGVNVRDGKLRASPLPFDANGNQIKDAKRSHLVIWNKRIFPENLLIEFEMSPNSSTSGLTIVFFCATGKNGEDIFDLSLPIRMADYKTYHSGAIANYSDSYFSRNTEVESLTNRMRKNPGFVLVAEGKSLTTGATDVPHHIRILKFGGHIEIEMDGKTLFKWDDTEKPLGAGRIGLRSMEGVSMITYDNLKVWEVKKK